MGVSNWILHVSLPSVLKVLSNKGVELLNLLMNNISQIKFAYNLQSEGAFGLTYQNNADETSMFSQAFDKKQIVKIVGTINFLSLHGPH